MGATASADFLMSFAKLSKKLAEKGISIYQLELYYGVFGSWKMIATKDKEAMRLSFDGKEHYLVAEVSSMQTYSAPRNWKPTQTKIAVKNSLESIEYAEKLLVEKFKP